MVAWQCGIRGVPSPQIATDAPIAFDGNGQRHGIQLTGNPLDVILIFLGIKGASTVDENASGTQEWPDVGNDAALQGGTAHR